MRPKTKLRKPRISVSMCTYNGSRHLPEQLKSIADQTLLPYELIVCDDGSTDDTIEILESFRNNVAFPVCIVCNAINLGSTRNFDQAISLALGEFIALSDQDDRWEKDKLERLSDILLEDESLGGVFSDVNLVDGQSQPIGLSIFERQRFTIAMQNRFRKSPLNVLLQRNVVTGASLMIRATVRNYYDTIPSCCVHDEWITWMIALHARIALLPDRLTNYRLHTGQQIGAPGRKSLADIISESKRERQNLSRVSDIFDTLQKYCTNRQDIKSSNIVFRLGQKRDFLSYRSKLSANYLRRILQIARVLPLYFRYDRGVKSVIKDFLLK